MVYGYLRDEGKSYTLASASSTIGRDPSCAVVVSGRSVSNQHACIEFMSGRAHLRDLNSRNGTFVNEERVQNSIIPLVHGDMLRFGYETAALRFEVEGVADGGRRERTEQRQQKLQQSIVPSGGDASPDMRGSPVRAASERPPALTATPPAPSTRTAAAAPATSSVFEDDVLLSKMHTAAEQLRKRIAQITQALAELVRSMPGSAEPVVIETPVSTTARGPQAVDSLLRDSLQRCNVANELLMQVVGGMQHQQQQDDVAAHAQATATRNVALEQYARDLQKRVVRLNKQVADQQDELQQVQQHEWARTMQQQATQLNALQDQLQLKEAEVQALQQEFANLARQASSGVSLQEGFHSAFVRTSSALQAARNQLNIMEQRQGIPARRWTELTDENQRLTLQLRAVEENGAATAARLTEAVRQRDERLATINAHLGQVAAGGTSRQAAVEFLIEQLREQEATLAAERARMQGTESQLAALQVAHAHDQEQLQQLRSETTASELQRLQDELTEMRALGCGDEALKLRDMNAALNEKIAKERARSRRLYCELKQARGASVDGDQSVDVLARLLSERDAVIANLQAKLAESNARHVANKHRVQAAESDAQRTTERLQSMQRRHERVVQAVRQHPNSASPRSTDTLPSPLRAPTTRTTTAARAIFSDDDEEAVAQAADNVSYGSLVDDAPTTPHRTPRVSGYAMPSGMASGVAGGMTTGAASPTRTVVGHGVATAAAASAAASNVFGVESPRSQQSRQPVPFPNVMPLQTQPPRRVDASMLYSNSQM